MDRALHNDGGQRVRIDPRYTDGVLFDVDGVITHTASIHQAAWAQLFDEYLAERTPADGENHARFTPGDYRHFIDGKPRYDGVRDFLASRGVTLPWGAASDGASAQTICGLGNRKQELFAARIADGVPVSSRRWPWCAGCATPACGSRCSPPVATAEPFWPRPASRTSSRPASTVWSPRNWGCLASRIRQC